MFTLNQNQLDTEPDVFSYSVPGHAGKFVFDADGKARTIPFDPIVVAVRQMDAATGIAVLEIQTPEGHTYTFDKVDAAERQQLGALPAYFQREFGFYQTSVRFNTAWHASRATTAAGETVEFDYRQSTEPARSPSSSRRLYWGSTLPATPSYEYKTRFTEVRHWLRGIRTRSTTVNFLLERAPEGGAYVTRIDVLSPLNDQSLIKSYVLRYSEVQSTYDDNRPWYDANGHALSSAADRSDRRRFLKSVQVQKTCASLPAYTFTYQGVSDRTTVLPPPASAEQDYWGFYNANRARTLAPRLYVDPALPPATPNWPYQLFAVDGAGQTTLDGADRQAGADFAATTLAGTLTAVQVPTGGRIFLEYEPHRFYDPTSATVRTGGGVRVQRVRLKDNISGTEQRREYRYLTDNGARSSGRLLHAPRFAFVAPTTESTSSPVFWAAATVRADADLVADPFVSRGVGYATVSEQVPGRGRSVHHYSLFATADDAAVGTEWARSWVGVARSLTSCAATLPVRAGLETYPFPPSTNCDFRQGLLQRIEHKAEPAAGGAEATVRTETFEYEWVKPPYRIRSVCFEPLPGTSGQAYAYATYDWLADGQYRLMRETQTTPDQATGSAGPGVTTAVSYRYNERGELAAVLKLNSDGTLYRTRYKYSADFRPSDPAQLGPRALALHVRWQNEGIRNDLVETIDEIQRHGTTYLTGLTVRTFQLWHRPQLATAGHEVWQWRPAQPMARTAYDSTLLRPVRPDAQELTFDSRLRLVSTAEDVNPLGVPLTQHLQAGRQLVARHLGHAHTLPVLSVQNAAAREVVFSDFESDKQWGWTVKPEPLKSLVVVKAAARSGGQVARLTPNVLVEGVVPASEAAEYRLTCWARATAGGTLRLALVDAAGRPAGWQQQPALATDGKWQRLTFTLNLATLLGNAPRTNYRVELRATAGQVDVDDVLLLPSTATAHSTTYEPGVGKTSETDAQGRTTWYEYNAVGELAVVRNHNGDVVRTFASSYGTPRQSGSVDFGVAAGDSTDSRPITFVATNSGCLDGITYRWEFGDPSSGAQNTATGASATHTFNTQNTDRSYNVTLRATTAQGRALAPVTKRIDIRRAALAPSLCAHGVVGVNLCANPVYYGTSSCDGSPAPRDGTEFRVTLPPTACGGPVVYTWEQNGPQTGGWQTVASGPAATLWVPMPTNRRGYKVRCTVRACGQEATTYEAEFAYEGSQGCDN